MKKLISVLLVLALSIGTMVFAQDENKITVILDGKEITFPDAQPFIDKRDRTLVPVRFVSEAMGAEVSWENDTQTAVIIKGRDTVRYTIGEIGGYLNGVKYPFDTVGVLKDDRTFVPLRFISELLNCKVEWVGETNTVVITSPSPAVKFPEPKLTVNFPNNEYTGKLFWITIDNIRDYSDCNNYQFKIDFINPVGFNEFEENDGEILGWQTYNRNQWIKGSILDPTIYWVSSRYYTTRANKENLNLYEGMPLEFVLSVKRMCSGEVKEYKYSEVFQYPYLAK